MLHVSLYFSLYSHIPQHQLRIHLCTVNNFARSLTHLHPENSFFFCPKNSLTLINLALLCKTKCVENFCENLFVFTLQPAQGRAFTL